MKITPLEGSKAKKILIEKVYFSKEAIFPTFYFIQALLVMVA